MCVCMCVCVCVCVCMCVRVCARVYMYMCGTIQITTNLREVIGFWEHTAQRTGCTTVRDKSKNILVITAEHPPPPPLHTYIPFSYAASLNQSAIQSKHLGSGVVVISLVNSNAESHGLLMPPSSSSSRMSSASRTNRRQSRNRSARVSNLE